MLVSVLYRCCIGCVSVFMGFVYGCRCCFWLLFVGCFGLLIAFVCGCWCSVAGCRCYFLYVVAVLLFVLVCLWGLGMVAGCGGR